MRMHLGSIHIYPVKSLGGFEVRSARLTDRGLEHDRRWMLVDADGNFMTQRELPLLACLHTAPVQNGFRVTDTRDGAHIELLWKLPVGDPRTVRVWSDRVVVTQGPKEHAAWFSERTGRALSLVHMPDTSLRATDRDHADALTSLSDGFPYLIASSASLNDLNRRIMATGGDPVPMDRFRPNLVIEGGTAFQEDAWSCILVGEVRFRSVKPCARCVITTTDQATGLRGAEPLRTLATYRRRGAAVLFAVNAVAETPGTITAGEPVSVVHEGGNHLSAPRTAAPGPA